MQRPEDTLQARWLKEHLPTQNCKGPLCLKMDDVILACADAVRKTWPTRGIKNAITGGNEQIKSLTRDEETVFRR